MYFHVLLKSTLTFLSAPDEECLGLQYTFCGGLIFHISVKVNQFVGQSKQQFSCQKDFGKSHACEFIK